MLHTLNLVAMSGAYLVMGCVAWVLVGVMVSAMLHGERHTDAAIFGERADRRSVRAAWLSFVVGPLLIPVLPVIIARRLLRWYNSLPADEDDRLWKQKLKRDVEHEALARRRRL